MTSFEVILPFYNEVQRIAETVAQLATEIRKIDFTRQGANLRFWWVDDGSTDHSSIKLKEQLERFPFLNARILQSEQNRGKGSAMRLAIETLKAEKCHESIVAFWDADGELDPQGLIEALQLVQDARADIVFGSRFTKRNIQVLNFRHYVGNKFLTLLSNCFSNLNLSDVHCCARVLRAQLLFQLPLTSTGFDFEAQFVGLIGRIRSPRLRLIEIPILYTPRSVLEGKKIGFSHVWPQILQAIRCRFFQKPLMLEASKARVRATDACSF